MHAGDEVTADYGEQMTQRCLGILTRDQLRALSEATVAGAGAGGVGGWTYLTLARFGCLQFRIADPECFDPSNANRQAGCTAETIGLNKAQIIAGEIRRINPLAHVEVFADGLRRETVHSFLHGADIVFDAIDLHELPTKRDLFDAAYERGVPIVTTPVLGFGAAVAVFDPARSPRFEEYFGPVPDKTDPIAYERYVKCFASRLFGFRPRLDWRSFMARLDAGQVPSLPCSCLLAGSLAATAAVDCLLHMQQFPVAPTTVHIDLLHQRVCRTGPLKRRLMNCCSPLYFRYLDWLARRGGRVGDDPCECDLVD